MNTTPFKQLASFLCLSASLVAVSAQAATRPSSIILFDSTNTEATFSAKVSSWRDPAFGDMGWTHSSAWGTVHAKRNQTVTIKVVSADAGLHPGVTVWLRGKDDTAPNKYVVDHFYPQNANFTEFGASDETTGKSIGNIIMRHIAHGYDADENSANVSEMNPITDGVAGQLELSFKATASRYYQFVVGGFNPSEGVDASVKHDFNVTVTVSDQ